MKNSVFNERIYKWAKEKQSQPGSKTIFQVIDMRLKTTVLLAGDKS